MPKNLTTKRLGLAVLVAVALVLLLRVFVIRPYEVASHSMTPTLLPGDHVLVGLLDYTFGEPERGDVVCFRSPSGEGNDFFGRVIALGGETLELREGKVHLNDSPQPLTEPYLTELYEEEFDSVVVPEGHLFILGDNRKDALDSRLWGALDAELLRGRAMLVYFSNDPYAVSEVIGPAPSVRWGRIGQAVR